MPRKSKKQSGAKYPSQPEDLTLFIDRNLGNNIIAKELRSVGLSVVVHDDILAIDTPDEDWIQLVGDKRWVAVTRDKNIRYRRAEIHAVREHKARVVVIRMKFATGLDMARLLIDNFHRLTKFTLQNPAPFIAGLSKNGKVTNYNIDE